MTDEINTLKTDLYILTQSLIALQKKVDICLSNKSADIEQVDAWYHQTIEKRKRELYFETVRFQNLWRLQLYIIDNGEPHEMKKAFRALVWYCQRAADTDAFDYCGYDDEFVEMIISEYEDNFPNLPGY